MRLSPSIARRAPCDSMKIVAWHTIRLEWVRLAVAVSVTLALVQPARSQEPITSTDWAQRIARADAQIELHPDDPALYASRGVSKMWLRQYEGAIADFTRAIQLKPDRFYYASRGDARFLACDFAGAAEDRKKETELLSSTRRYELMLEEVSALRRLPFLNPVPVLHRYYLDMELMTAWEFDQDPASAGFHGEDLTYERLGIAPKGFSIRDSSLWPRGGAYYDNVMQAVFTSGSSGEDTGTLAHEFTHVLQDQNFSTDAIESARADNSDALFAFETLEEGDAVALGSYWKTFYPESRRFYVDAVPFGRDDPTRGQIGSLLPEPTAPRRVAPAFSTFLKQTTLESWIKTAIDASASPRSTEAFADLMVTTPKGEWVLPLSYTEDVYKLGPPFIEELRKRGGWERVNAAYREMPRSSTQIMHPEKYFAREEPVEITLPDISGRLGQRWKRIRSDTLGEYSYAHIFNLTLPKSEKERNTIAAAGWRGDRYSTYEGPQPGDVCMIQVSVWDTEQDAREFFEQYERHILHRYPSAKAVPQRSGAHVWTTNEGGVFLDRQGRAVLIAEGVPESAGRKPRAVPPAERPRR